MVTDVFSLALVDGVPVPFAEVPLATFAPGFFFGAGFFETMRVDEGRVRFLPRHIARIQSALSAVTAVESPPRELMQEATVAAQLASVLTAVKAAGGPTSLVVKWAVAGGHTLATFRPPPENLQSRWDEGDDVSGLSHEGYRGGESLLAHKSLSYLSRYARKDDAVLFVNDRNEVCEMPTANVFFRVDGVIRTPSLIAPCLAGTVRQVLLDGGQLGEEPIIEAPMPAADLALVDAAFATNAVVGAVPLRSILGRQLPESRALAARARTLVDAIERAS